jgi:glycine/D-amino acid oxidase-like deaminating enzyme
LLEKRPGAKVVVLERGSLPTGASTKNAGFACFGSLSELVVDRSQLPDDQVCDLVSARWMGLQKLRKRLGDAALRYEGCGGYELMTSAESHYLEQLDSVNDLLQPLFGQAVFQLVDDEIQQHGLSKSKVKHMVSNPLEGQLDPAAMIRALLRYVQERGGMVLTGCEVLELEEKEDRVELQVQMTGQVSPQYFRASQLAICTNAFSSSLKPDLAFQPGRGQILITEPIPGLALRGVFHYQEGYYYFRRVGDRLLMGGGRNLDFSGEQTTAFELSEVIQESLEAMIREVVLPNQAYTVAHRWSGIMAFGANKAPICERLSARQVIGVRLGGMGVAIGSEWGDRLSALLLGDSAD